LPAGNIAHPCKNAIFPGGVASEDRIEKLAKNIEFLILKEI
jgi:hypothetical protein